jgi:hypothetical protein
MAYEVINTKERCTTGSNESGIFDANEDNDAKRRRGRRIR